MRIYIAGIQGFQSTLPVWGATNLIYWIIKNAGDFNPRSPCGERRTATRRDITRYTISIHAPRVGSDFVLYILYHKLAIFQSTLPVWGATLPYERTKIE